MSPEAQRWAELFEKVQGALSDVVPPEAQVHLLNAQRELLTAMVIIYEHGFGSRGQAASRAAKPSSRSRRPRPTAYRGRIEID